MPTIDDYSPLRPVTETENSASRLKTGSGWIVFHHFRKAAGSSILSYLKRVLSELAPVSSRQSDLITQDEGMVYIQENVKLYHQEWGVFPMCCLQAPDEPHAVLVTALREPLSRILSEFNYAGPGKKLNFNVEEELVSAWKEWISDRYNPKRKAVQRGRYIDNFYTRSLIGDCGSPHKEVPAHDHVPFSGRGKDRPFRGGCFLDTGKLTIADLQLAKEVLRSFNIVFVTERLNEDRVLDWALTVFGVSNLSFGSMEHLNSGENTASKGVEDPIGIPKEIHGFLEEDNAFDIELFQFAQSFLEFRVSTYERTGKVVY